MNLLRRQRLRQGIPGREAVPRRQDRPDLRGHVQPAAADDRQADPGLAVRSPHSLALRARRPAPPGSSISETLHYGFDYDDYHFLRPYTPARSPRDVSRPLGSPGIEVKFYRPLTIVLYAVRFELFGLNATAHHAVVADARSRLPPASTGMARLPVDRARRGRPRWPPCSSCAIRPCRTRSSPGSPTRCTWRRRSIVLTALVWWHAVRARPLVWWLPLLVFGVAAFMVKEDGIMLLPAILTVHAITRRVAEPEPAAGSMGLRRPVGRLLVVRSSRWRSTALGELGGYGRPTLHAALGQLLARTHGVFRLVPADRPWQPRRELVRDAAADRGDCRLALDFCAGRASACWPAVAIAVLFNLPFIFVTKAEQMYLVGIGAAIDARWRVAGAAGSCRAHAGAAAADAWSSASFSALASRRSSRSRGTSPATSSPSARSSSRTTISSAPGGRCRPSCASTWRASASLDAASARLAQSARRAVAGHLRRLGPGDQSRWRAATCGCPGREPRFTSPPSARSVTIPLRHPIEAFREPTRARIDVDGRLVDDLPLATPEWRMSTLPLRPADVPRVSRMHRIRITIDHAWRPSEVIPGSTDERVLALQIGEVGIR